MRKFNRVAIACAALVAVCASNAVIAAPPPVIPASAFAAHSPLDQPELSPNGTKFVARASTEGKPTLIVAGLDGGQQLLNLPPQIDLIDYEWAGNDRLLLTIGDEVVWYDRGKKYITRTFVYDLKTDKAFIAGPKVQGTWHDLISVGVDGKSLLMTTQTDQFSYPSVFRVNLDTGKSALIQTPYDNVWSWYGDETGNLRAGVGYLDAGWFILYRPTGSGSYKRSATFPYKSNDILDFEFGRDGSDQGYVLSSKSGFRAVYRFNFVTSQIGELVYGKPGIDVDDFGVDDVTRELLWVSLADDDGTTIWFDEDSGPRTPTREALFTGQTVQTVSRAYNRSARIVWAGTATDPGAFYLIRQPASSPERLARVAPAVNRAGLSTTKPVQYKARDGLTIAGYLTLPVGRAPKNLPLIIMPHGGPFGIRDTLGYDHHVQFLANRGYAVLQPNYRGSAGYGEAFAAAGDGQWGRAMQDDIDDGMDFLVREGTVDAKRVCIVGASYGGYVASWGATRNPERYRCAVSLFGISDLKAQAGHWNDFLTRTEDRDYRAKIKGQKDFDMLSISPITHATNLKVPILLVHGDADKRVPVSQTIAYDKALTKAGKVHETYIYPDAGHGFSKAADDVSYLERLEAFLTKHNPAN